MPPRKPKQKQKLQPRKTKRITLEDDEDDEKDQKQEQEEEEEDEEDTASSSSSSDSSSSSSSSSSSGSDEDEKEAEDEEEEEEEQLELQSQKSQVDDELVAVVAAAPELEPEPQTKTVSLVKQQETQSSTRCFYFPFFGVFFSVRLVLGGPKVVRVLLRPIEIVGYIDDDTSFEDITSTWTHAARAIASMSLHGTSASTAAAQSLALSDNVSVVPIKQGWPALEFSSPPSTATSTSTPTIPLDWYPVIQRDPVSKTYLCVDILFRRTRVSQNDKTRVTQNLPWQSALLEPCMARHHKQSKPLQWEPMFTGLFASPTEQQPWYGAPDAPMNSKLARHLNAPPGTVFVGAPWAHVVFEAPQTKRAKSLRIGVAWDSVRFQNTPEALLGNTHFKLYLTKERLLWCQVFESAILLVLNYDTEKRTVVVLWHDTGRLQWIGDFASSDEANQIHGVERNGRSVWIYTSSSVSHERKHFVIESSTVKLNSDTNKLFLSWKQWLPGRADWVLCQAQLSPRPQGSKPTDAFRRQYDILEFKRVDSSGKEVVFGASTLLGMQHHWIRRADIGQLAQLIFVYHEPLSVATLTLHSSAVSVRDWDKIVSADAWDHAPVYGGLFFTVVANHLVVRMDYAPVMCTRPKLLTEKIARITRPLEFAFPVSEEKNKEAAHNMAMDRFMALLFCVARGASAITANVVNQHNQLSMLAPSNIPLTPIKLSDKHQNKMCNFTVTYSTLVSRTQVLDRLLPVWNRVEKPTDDVEKLPPLSLNALFSWIGSPFVGFGMLHPIYERAPLHTLNLDFVHSTATASMCDIDANRIAFRNEVGAGGLMLFQFIATHVQLRVGPNAVFKSWKKKQEKKKEKKQEKKEKKEKKKPKDTTDSTKQQKASLFDRLLKSVGLATAAKAALLDKESTKIRLPKKPAALLREAMSRPIIDVWTEKRLLEVKQMTGRQISTHQRLNLEPEAFGEPMRVLLEQCSHTFIHNSPMSVHPDPLVTYGYGLKRGTTSQHFAAQAWAVWEYLQTNSAPVSDLYTAWQWLVWQFVVPHIFDDQGNSDLHKWDLWIIERHLPAMSAYIRAHRFVNSYQKQQPLDEEALETLNVIVQQVRDKSTTRRDVGVPGQSTDEQTFYNVSDLVWLDATSVLSSATRGVIDEVVGSISYMLTKDMAVQPLLNFLSWNQESLGDESGNRVNWRRALLAGAEHNDTLQAQYNVQRKSQIASTLNAQPLLDAMHAACRRRHRGQLDSSPVVNIRKALTQASIPDLLSRDTHSWTQLLLWILYATFPFELSPSFSSGEEDGDEKKWTPFKSQQLQFATAVVPLVNPSWVFSDDTKAYMTRLAAAFLVQNALYEDTFSFDTANDLHGSHRSGQWYFRGQMSALEIIHWAFRDRGDLLENQQWWLAEHVWMRLQFMHKHLGWVASAMVLFRLANVDLPERYVWLRACAPQAISKALRNQLMELGGSTVGLGVLLEAVLREPHQVNKLREYELPTDDERERLGGITRFQLADTGNDDHTSLAVPLFAVRAKLVQLQKTAAHQYGGSSDLAVYDLTGNSKAVELKASDLPSGLRLARGFYEKVEEDEKEWIPFQTQLNALQNEIREIEVALTVEMEQDKTGLLSSLLFSLK